MLSVKHPANFWGFSISIFKFYTAVSSTYVGGTWHDNTRWRKVTVTQTAHSEIISKAYSYYYYQFPVLIPLYFFDLLQDQGNESFIYR